MLKRAARIRVAFFLIYQWGHLPKFQIEGAGKLIAVIFD